MQPKSDQMSRTWLHRFIVGRCDGHIVDGHMQPTEAVIDYIVERPMGWSGRTRTAEVSIPVDTRANVSL